MPHADKKGNSSAEPSTEGKASDFDTTHEEAVLTSGMSSYSPHNHSGTVSRGLSEEQDALLTEIQRQSMVPSKQKIDSADTQDQIAKPSESERAVRSPRSCPDQDPRGRGLGARESISH